MSAAHDRLPGWAKPSLLGALVLLLAGLALSWGQPLLDQHDFRQTQTAISSYWMTRGGPLWLYETPLFGPPWTVPFEFPLYQWLVAAIAGSGLPITLDQSARVVSLAALVACVWPLRVSLRQLHATPELIAAASVLFLASPVHAFWGRAVMVESLALLLAMGFLAVIQLSVARRDWSLVAAATVLATAAILVKVTTLFAFAALAGTVVAFAIAADLKSRQYRRALFMAIASALPMAVALIALIAWLDVSDAAKASSPFTAWLGSAELSRWNYGTVEQRMSADFWVGAVIKRMLPDVIGLSAWLVPALLVLGFHSKDRSGMLLWLLAPLSLFLLPMLVFTNLHQIHNYYQVANAVFLVVCLAALVDHASRGRSYWLAPALTLACAAAMVVHSWNHFLPEVTKDQSNHPALALARVIRETVAREDVIVTAGLDWSATVPYYSQRRAVMLLRESDMLNIPALLPTRERPSGANVGALVQCGPGYEFMNTLTARLGPDPLRIEAGGCIVTVRR